MEYDIIFWHILFFCIGCLIGNALATLLNHR